MFPTEIGKGGGGGGVSSRGGLNSAYFMEEDSTLKFSFFVKSKLGPVPNSREKIGTGMNKYYF